MTRIDFYVLAGANERGRELFACKLIEKAYKLGNRIVLRTDNDAQSQRLDDLLWTFRQGSFIPHDTNPDQRESPVFIGQQHNAGFAAEVLVNLGQSIPDGIEQFQRIAEIVDNDEINRENARHRFRHYRGLGLDVNSHDV